MKLKKNLANCTPKEFLVQTNRIRKSAEKWLKVTDIINIRKNVPKLEPLPEDPEGMRDALADHKEKVRQAGLENLSRIYDAVAGEHPDETVEILALLNFIEPKDADKYPISEYLRNTKEILNNEDVIDFFTSLMRLAQKNI